MISIFLCNKKMTSYYTIDLDEAGIAPIPKMRNTADVFLHTKKLCQHLCKNRPGNQNNIFIATFLLPQTSKIIFIIHIIINSVVHIRQCNLLSYLSTQKKCLF